MTEYVVRVDEKRKPSDHPSDPLLWLLGLPALEEVIRCRDCAHMDKVIEFADGDGWSDSRAGVPFCHKHLAKTMESNFCSWAERREP